MSITSALRAGVTGLSANAAGMAVISDNIANVNTVGYKRGISDFAALINAGAGRGAYNAGGVLASTRQQVDVQGAIQQTRNPTDLAISGDGFFIVTADPTAAGAASGGVFTRAGTFTPDPAGRLVNDQGYYLLGAQIDPTQDTNSTVAPASIAALRTIDLSNQVAVATPTDRLAINANLNSETTAVPINNTAAAPGRDLEPVLLGDPGYFSGRAGSTFTASLERTVEIYDSLGSVRTLTMSFMKVNFESGAAPPVAPDNAPNTWYAEIYWRPAPDQPGRTISSGFVQFDANGRVQAAPNAITTAPAAMGLAQLPAQLTIPWSNQAFFNVDGVPSGAADQTITPFDYASGLTQFAAPSALASATANGSPPGELVGVSVDREGVLTAQYSNGRSQALYRIPVATFLNPNGLEAAPGSAFRQTVESGLLTINTPGQGGAGVIQSSAVEGSNVDLGTEFTQLIQVQRAYSASSRIISIADQMIQELLQISR